MASRSAAELRRGLDPSRTLTSRPVRSSTSTVDTRRVAFGGVDRRDALVCADADLWPELRASPVAPVTIRSEAGR